MNEYLYLILIIVTFLICAIFGVIVLINRITNKSNKTKAEKMLDELFKSMESDLFNDINDYIKNLDISKFDTSDPAQQFNIIESSILDFSFNKASKMINDLLNEKFPDGKSSIYSIILNYITHDKIEDVVKELLQNNEIKDMITNIYNQCFGEYIDEIEVKDKELAEELSQYEENAEIIDETIEQHDQTIEEYAKSHIQEKIDELNEVYDEAEKDIPNTVPVRDLSALKPLINYYENAENLNPPKDNPDEESFNEDVDEIVEYINDEKE
jgi:hypothetical protein